MNSSFGKIVRVAITGPESTGKSRLCSDLAHFYSGQSTGEYAREYIASQQNQYDYEDILAIAKGQIEKENDVLNLMNSGFFFTDTELIVTKIWCIHKFGKCHDWILNSIPDQRYDLYLLCNIDLPWEYDPQREHPHLREYFMKWYEKELLLYQKPYTIVSGEGDGRLQCAVKAIEHRLNGKTKLENI